MFLDLSLHASATRASAPESARAGLGHRKYARRRARRMPPEGGRRGTRQRREGRPRGAGRIQAVGGTCIGSTGAWCAPAVGIISALGSRLSALLILSSPGPVRAALARPAPGTAITTSPRRCVRITNLPPPAFRRNHGRCRESKRRGMSERSAGRRMFLDPPLHEPFGTHVDQSLLHPCRFFSHDPDPSARTLHRRPRYGSRRVRARQRRCAAKDKPMMRRRAPPILGRFGGFLVEFRKFEEKPTRSAPNRGCFHISVQGLRGEPHRVFRRPFRPPPGLSGPWRQTIQKSYRPLSRASVAAGGVSGQRVRGSGRGWRGASAMTGLVPQ